MTISLEEHVARAIWLDRYPEWKAGPTSIPDDYMAMARAAIAAVREREGTDRILLDALREARRCLTTTPLRLEVRANVVDRLDIILSDYPAPDPAEAMRATKQRPGVHCWGYGCMMDPICVEHARCTAAAEAMRHVTADESRILHSAILASSEIIDHGTDPAEAMRAQCEAIARKHCYGDQSAEDIADKIAALKGNGEEAR